MSCFTVKFKSSSFVCTLYFYAIKIELATMVLPTKCEEENSMFDRQRSDVELVFLDDFVMDFRPRFLNK